MLWFDRNGFAWNLLRALNFHARIDINMIY